jgi:hypothetical protein
MSEQGTILNTYEGSVENGRKSVFLALMACFAIDFAISVAILYIYEVRPMSYYILMTVLAFVLLLEILYAGRKGWWSLAILFQIAAYTLNLIWGVTLNYYLFIGRTDTMDHLWWAENLLSQGHVTSVFGLYQAFPLWHILCDSIYMIAGWQGQLSQVMFINSGLVYAILGILCMYLLVRKITGDERLSLIATLFLSFNTTFQFYGMYSIPRSIAMVLFILLMILLVDYANKTKRWLAYLLSFSIVVYHTVTSLFIIVILALAYLIQKVFVKSKENPVVTLGFLAFFVCITAAYWAVNAANIIWTIYDSLAMSSMGATGLQTGSVNTAPMSEVFNYIQYSIVILFVLVGAVLLLKLRSTDVRLKIFALVSLVLIPIAYPGPLLLMNTLSSTASIGRFEEYSFMFMVIISAAGFYLLYRKNSKLINIVIIVLFILMAFLSLTDDFVATDNPLLKRPFYTDYMQESEIYGLNNVANFTTGYVMTDYVGVRYLQSSPYVAEMHIMEINDTAHQILTSSGNDVVLIRDGELDVRPLLVFTADYGYVSEPSWNTLDYYNKGDPAFDSLQGMDLVYNSNTMSAYTPGGYP